MRQSSWVFVRYHIKNFISVNPVYKLSSLGIAILLWLIISSRREFEVTKNFDIEFRLSDSKIIQTYKPRQIRVHLFGSRASLKRVLEGQWSNVVVLDASALESGVHRLRVDRNRIELPFGTRALAVSPSMVEFEIQNSPQ